MLKEFLLPQIFSVPRKKLIRASGLKTVSFKRKAAVFFLAALNAGLLLAYIFSVNANASAGFEIKALQGKISRLNQENKKLSLLISERTLVANLENELLKSGFTFVQSAKFLAPGGQYSQK